MFADPVAVGIVGIADIAGLQQLVGGVIPITDGLAAVVFAQPVTGRVIYIADRGRQRWLVLAMALLLALALVAAVVFVGDHLLARPLGIVDPDQAVDRIVLVAGHAAILFGHRQLVAFAVVGVLERGQNPVSVAAGDHPGQPVVVVVAVRRPAVVGQFGIDHPAQRIVAVRGDLALRIGEGGEPVGGVVGVGVSPLVRIEH